MLRLLGIDHEKLTYRAQGRDFRLTDVSGEVIKPILVVATTLKIDEISILLPCPQSPFCFSSLSA